MIHPQYVPQFAENDPNFKWLNNVKYSQVHIPQSCAHLVWHCLEVNTHDKA